MHDWDDDCVVAVRLAELTVISITTYRLMTRSRSQWIRIVSHSGLGMWTRFAFANLVGSCGSDQSLHLSVKKTIEGQNNHHAATFANPWASYRNTIEATNKQILRP